jgi:hypothetical protein
VVPIHLGAQRKVELIEQRGGVLVLTLNEPSFELVLAHTKLKKTELDLTVTLYAAVAKTLKESGNDDLGHSYSPDADGNMTIPVKADSVRGLILVFTKGPAESPTQLIASTDPEIKNSTG